MPFDCGLVAVLGSHTKVVNIPPARMDILRAWGGFVGITGRAACR